MSKIAIKGATTGTGVFTLESPATNTDRTLVLPDEAGTVLTSASGLTAGNLTGSVPASAMPAGSVLQVVQYAKVGIIGSNQPSLLVTNSSSIQTVMSKSITTIGENSKILVNVGCIFYSSAGAVRTTTYMYRGATYVFGDKYGIYEQSGSLMRRYTAEYLDSPNVSAGTTLTYDFKVAVTNSLTTSIGYGDSGGGSTDYITLTEIAA